MQEFTLHFLVHPGYGTVNRRLGENMSREWMQQEKRLFRRYREKLGSLGEDDVLVIFTPMVRPEHEQLEKGFDEAFKQGRCGDARELLKSNRWLGVVKKAQELMGNRCLTFPSPLFLPPFRPVVDRSPRMSDVDEELKKRGFEVTPETPCQVWGTSLSSMDTSCVVNTAEKIQEYFGLKKFPSIMVDSTNCFEADEKELEKLSKDLEKRLPKARGSIKKERT